MAALSGFGECAICSRAVAAAPGSHVAVVRGCSRAAPAAVAGSDGALMKCGKLGTVGESRAMRVWHCTRLTALRQTRILDNINQWFTTCLKFSKRRSEGLRVAAVRHLGQIYEEGDLRSFRDQPEDPPHLDTERPEYEH